MKSNHARRPQPAAIDVSWAIELGQYYSSLCDVTYATASNVQLKLDLYKPKAKTNQPRPTLLYFHGGGWMGEFTKSSSLFQLLPFLQLGWTVINADYRPSSVSLAPAAVEDGLCALRWIGRTAAEHAIDLSQVVIMGRSAGAHLALTTGMIPLSATGLSAPSQYLDMYDAAGKPKPQPSVRAAAIINWCGITDVVDLLEGPHQQPYAVTWIGNQPDRIALAKSVSPLSYVRPDLPAIITIHGTKDECVPHDHAVRLHRALDGAGVRNKLISVVDGEHAPPGAEALRQIYPQILDFLHEAGLTGTPA